MVARQKITESRESSRIDRGSRIEIRKKAVIARNYLRGDANSRVSLFALSLSLCRTT